MPRSVSRTGLAVALLGAGVMLAGLTGCRGDRSDAPPRRFFPDLDDQPKWDPQEATEFFADKRVSRPLPPGTVAFSGFEFDPAGHAGEDWAQEFLIERAMLLAEDEATFTGAVIEEGERQWVEYSPVPVTMEMIERGQERFNVFCAACHGYLADSQGMVGRKWSYPPANLLGEPYTDRSTRQGTDGWIFHVIREGVWGTDGANRMPGYKHAVDTMDAWAIVAYLRALQQSQGATPDDLTPTERATLNVATTPMQGPAGGADSAVATADTTTGGDS